MAAFYSFMDRLDDYFASHDQVMVTLALMIFFVAVVLPLCLGKRRK